MAARSLLGTESCWSTRLHHLMLGHAFYAWIFRQIHALPGTPDTTGSAHGAREEAPLPTASPSGAKVLLGAKATPAPSTHQPFLTSRVQPLRKPVLQTQKHKHASELCDQICINALGLRNGFFHENCVMVHISAHTLCHVQISSHKQCQAFPSSPVCHGTVTTHHYS